MISVVVPAHNEERAIGHCLSAMLGGAKPLELEIVVVCNACTDRTAEVARSFGDAVTVVETDIASKSDALNVGDQIATCFPRLYVDADIVLPLESIRKVFSSMNRRHLLAASPQLKVDLEHCNWGIRAYYDIWTRLPYVSENLIGSGVYALTEEGRLRFDNFPAIIADDGFVRAHFKPTERATVPGAWFLMTPPTSLSDLIRISTRRWEGTLELARKLGHQSAGEGQVQRAAIYSLLRRPRLWPSMAVYVYVKVATRIRHWWKYRGEGHQIWDRDESSRRIRAEYDSEGFD
jgi:glycosyltransferase involved in cell wall biosynthesis